MRVPPVVEPGPPLTAARAGRWSRHLLLPEVGELGQRRLAAARVCVVGAGGLGAPVLLYLAAAGVGRIGIVDVDDVEVTNLQRQVVHGEADVGRPKVESARDAVHAVDPEVDVVLHHVRLDASNVDDVLGGYDLVIDGTDNFPTRYLVNDACVRLGLPEVWGSVFRFDAQVAVFWGRPPAGVDPVDLRDLFPEPPAPGTVPSCAEAGVLGAMCGQVGSLMATEALKLITGVGQPLLGRVLVLDALAARWTEVPLRGRPAGERITDRSDRTAAVVAESSGTQGGLPAHSPAEAAVAPSSDLPTTTVRELAARLEARAAGRDDFELLDVREPGEHDLVAIPGARLLPLARVLDGSGLAELPPGRPIVVHCRSGARSAQAAVVLRALGHDVTNLDGGVLAWARDVDPSLPTY